MVKSHTVARLLRRWLLPWAVIAAGLCFLAGTVRDPWLWAYVGAFAFVGSYGMLTLDEDLARERFTPPSPGADRVPLRWIRLVAFAHLVVGALDSGRWHLAPVSPLVRVVGLAGVVVTALVVFRAMHANHYFSAVVRIQHDRGHHVVDTGPYSLVRHPGYAGMIPLVPFSGLALGSWLGFAVGLLYSALILRRVLFEDDFLQRNLAGYRDYTERVRYRLLPGVW